ncbi:hypothetical protein [Neoroseomonas soli]|uniref:Uncharacterized protein n=1 Tax=Neoroseomonas soli TaxID=1081025 RepID=A0A9X9WVY1_9PROT|nr:hypothetical protein [Neoroseomonas soli]MBR0671310.1 hypothetical protein [Neoroseomonas soli]
MTVALLGALVSHGAPGNPAGGGAQPASLRYVQDGCRMLGPFASMRRANEVASEARGYGYSVTAYHNGDGYYVRAC